MIIQVSRVFLKKIYFSLMSLTCWLSTSTNTINTTFNKTNSSTSQLPTEDCQMGRSGLTGLFFSYIISFFKKKRYGNHSACIFHLFLFSASSAHFSSLVCEQDDCQNLVNIEIRLSQFTQLVVNQSPLATQLSYTYALGKRATFSNLAYWLYQLYEFI